MKLYSMAGTCALSVQVALEWTGEPYDIEVLPRGAHKQAAYLAISPAGQVPALVLSDGMVLLEAPAILTFITDSFPQANGVAYETPRDRYALAAMLSFLNSEVHVAFKPFFAPARFIADEAQFSAVRTAAFVALDPLMGRLNDVLSNSMYLLGEHRSVADAYFYALLRWMDNAPQRLGPYPYLSTYRAFLERDSGVLRGLQTHGMATVGRGA